MEKTIVSSVEEWKGVAEELLDNLGVEEEPALVLVLSGDLGSGKTTFVQALANILGVEETITSPTFNIIKSYQTQNPNFTNLIHMDAYRLESEEELAPLHFNELLQTPRTIFCIEWGEKIRNSLPNNTHFLQFDINQDNQHTIQKV